MDTIKQPTQEQEPLQLNDLDLNNSFEPEDIPTPNKATTYIKTDDSKDKYSRR